MEFRNPDFESKLNFKLLTSHPKKKRSVKFKKVSEYIFIYFHIIVSLQDRLCQSLLQTTRKVIEVEEYQIPSLDFDLKRLKCKGDAATNRWQVCFEY